MDILTRKGREVDHRTSPNSMDSEWCFSKRGRGEKRREDGEEIGSD